MGRGTTRRPKPKESSRPSIFFIIALAIGIALLVWAFSRVIRRPASRRGERSGVPAMARIVPSYRA